MRTIAKNQDRDFGGLAHFTHVVKKNRHFLSLKNNELCEQLFTDELAVIQLVITITYGCKGMESN